MSYLNIGGISYKFEDFRRVDGFVQAMEDNANEEVWKDVTNMHGTKPTKAEIPADFHDQVYQAFQENCSFHPDPESANFDPLDLQMCCLYNVSNALCMCGMKEHHKLE
eukprot:936366-Ditylum_brightwellii.AAC.1